MSSSLDMSLDDIIRRKKGGAGGSNSSIRGRNGGRGSGFVSGPGPGPERRHPRRDLDRAVPYPVQPAMQLLEPMMMMGLGGSDGEAGTKLYLSNLDYDVSNEDIQGTGEVIFKHQKDAIAAIRRYNNVRLDGKPMKIEIVGLGPFIPAPLPPPPAAGILANPHMALGSRQENIGGRGMGHGVGRGGSRGRGTARGGGPHGHGRRSQGVKLSAEALDTELEKYHFDAMKMK